MKYLNPSFSISMPGDGSAWPFDDIPKGTYDTGDCPSCGADTLRREGRILPHYTPEDASRVRRRVCFG